jgi:hypothetical protein
MSNEVNLIKLKIKSKHLAEEVKIIKFELQKNKSPMQRYIRQSIESHLNGVVRTEVRATQLAIAFLKDKPYKSVEPNTKIHNVLEPYVIPRIVSMVQKYGYIEFPTFMSYQEWANKMHYGIDGKQWFDNRKKYFEFIKQEKSKYVAEMIRNWIYQ